MACLIRSATSCALVVMLCAAPAFADAAAQAKATAKAAKAAFDLGHFDEALAKYEQAYQLKSVPGLLFNIGQCHRQLGKPDRALHFFKQYLESGPPRAQADATAEVIRQIEAQLASEKKQREAAAEQERALELEKARAEASRVEAEKEKERLRLAEAENAERRRDVEHSLKPGSTQPTPESPSILKKWWFWTGVGVVAAAAGTGVYVATMPRATPTTWNDINAR